METRKSLKPREIQKATPRGVVSEFHKPPLTISGFRVFGHSKGVTVHHYFSNPDNSYDAYRSICSRITDEIRQDQIEGGMVGQYNPSITQRLNNLTEKQEIEYSGKVDSIKITIVDADKPTGDTSTKEES